MPQRLVRQGHAKSTKKDSLSWFVVEWGETRKRETNQVLILYCILILLFSDYDGACSDHSFIGSTTIRLPLTLIFFFLYTWYTSFLFS